MDQTMCQAVSSQQGLSGALQLQLCVLTFWGRSILIGPELLGSTLKHEGLALDLLTAHKPYSDTQYSKKPTKISHGPVFCILWILLQSCH